MPLKLRQRVAVVASLTQQQGGAMAEPTTTEDWGLIADTPPATTEDWGLITDTPPATTQDWGTLV